MNEAFNLDREFLFKTNIYEITSISLENTFNIDNGNLEGEFVISGDYRLHEISINKEDFVFKVPFKHELRSNINLDTVKVDITDFNYNFQNGDELSVHIEYLVTADEGIIEFADEKSLDEFLNTNEAEVVDLTSNNNPEFELNDNELRENDVIDVVDNVKDDNADVKQNLILNSINSDDEYVKYHVHIVTMDDTIENICSKYKVNLNTLKKYNTFENLELNMKLIIPENEEN